MGKELPQAFFHRPALDVARDLLGCDLVARSPDGMRRSTITEVEAYDGPEDKACHAHKGRTKRTEIMFARGGVWYVYFVYGMHWMLNIVTGEEGYPAAVLIRGLHDVKGPGRLTRAYGIDRCFNGKVCAHFTGLWIEEAGERPREKDVLRTPRIGVGYAQEWKDVPYRFVWKKPDVLG